jgi:peptide/nickel transport system substrate-binding protein
VKKVKFLTVITVAVVLVIAILMMGCSKPTATTTAPSIIPTSTSPQTTAPTSTTAPATTTTNPTTSATTVAPTTTTPTGAQPQYGGILKIMVPIPQGPDFGWPLVASWMHMWPQQWLNQEHLVYVTMKGDVQPMLAESWKYSSDQTSITFNLRKGVKFHDGTPFNAEAVKFIMDANIEAKTGVATAWKSVDIVDDSTVRLNLNYYENTLFQDLASQTMSFVSPTQVREKGIEYAKTHAIGTGPFKFASFQADQYVKFERFNDYWGIDSQGNKMPFLDQVWIVQVPDQMTMEAALQSGEYQAMGIQKPITMAKFRDLGYQVYPNAAGTQAILPDNDPTSHFADIRVRQALEYAMDKKGIVAATGFGYNEVNNQFPNIPNSGWNPNLPWKEYDVAKAKQLLTDAGYPNGFKTTLHTHNDYIQITEIIKQQLAKININATINNVDNLVFYQLVSSGWKDSLLVLDNSWEPNFAASWRADFPPYGSLYKSTIIPANAKELIDAATTAATHEAEIQANWAFSKALMDVQALIPIYSDALGYVVAPTVHNGRWSEGMDWQAWRADGTWMEQ